MKGDPAAFEELVRGEERRLFAVALRYMRSRPDAEDCLQEAMLKIYRSLSLFKQNSSFSTWAYRITVNVCLDELRRRKNAVQSLDDMTDAQMPQDDRDRPEDTAEKGELARNVRQAIGELPEDMRTVILLRDVEGYTYEEISQLTGAAEGTVKSRISRARERLRQVFMKKPELFDEECVKGI